MNQRFKDQVVLVTGGANGLGKAIAKRIASEGGQVAILDLVECDCISTVEEFRSNGWKASGHQVDITNEDQVAQAMQSIAESTKRIDIVVNSAGVVGPTSTNVIVCESFCQQFGYRFSFDPLCLIETLTNNEKL